MLSELYIENIAVIERADISLSGGFNVLSGETGAGKSIIIDSLNAIIGARVSREIIRTGETRAAVTARFTHLPAKSVDTAAHLGFEPEDGAFVIRREIYADGRNACRINGRPANLSALKAIGESLVCIHGQHDGQNLLNEALHIEYLDEFGGLSPRLDSYVQKYESLLQLNRRIKSTSLCEAEKERLHTRLIVEIAELSKAEAQPGEYEMLRERRASLVSAEKLCLALGGALAAIDGGDEQPGALDLMLDAIKRLVPAGKQSAEAEALAVKLTEMSSRLTELSGEMSQTLLRQEFSSQLLEETERRLDLLTTLGHKYDVPPDGLAEHLTSLRQELDSIDQPGGDLDALKTEYARLRFDVLEEAGQLHLHRVDAAGRMKQRIESELASLDMPAARFFVEIESSQGSGQARFTKRGTDSVRFLLSANSGEDLRQLSKVASGGELSRIMLALKTVLSAGDGGLTAVYDEIDAGVSGRAASRVGEKLYYSAIGRQVLCVTHLPQIACLADNQYHISKQSKNGRTFTEVTLLDRAGRIEEIARLNAGLHVSEATLLGAAELLDQAERSKHAFI